MWSKPHSRKSVAFGNVSIKLVVFEEGKGIDIEIERFNFNGVRVATRSELMKQIGFGSLGKGNSRHKMREQGTDREESNASIAQGGSASLS